MNGRFWGRQYDDDSSENYAMESELSIPNNAQGITRSVDYESVENQKRLNVGYIRLSQIR